MATLLADTEDARAETPPVPAGDAAANGATPAPEAAQPPAAAACSNCGAAMVPGQDWCLQCGAGAPGSVDRAGWRGAAAIALLTVVLVLGAAGAGYAALSKHPRRAPVRTTTVAQAAPPATTAPATTPPATSTPQTFSTPAIAPPAVGTAKAPKIPLKAATPPATVPTPALAPTPATSSKETAGGGKETAGGGTQGSGEGGTGNGPEPLLLDTNAASTYNPYAYPASDFGDPSLAIDGDGSTGWTALVNPTTAPKLAEGLLIDLKSVHKLGSVKLVTATPGIAVQVYGTTAATPPSSITDPAWVPLSRSVMLRKRHAHVDLLSPKHSVRFLAIWISAAPASAVGTPEAPGHVSINELELFPAA